MKSEPSEPSSLYQCFTSGEPLWTYLPPITPSEPLLSEIFTPPASSEPLSIPTYLTSPWYGAVSSLTPLYRKARIFVSYHHRLDQSYYDSLSRFVSVDYEVLYDNSPERAKDSDDAEYIIRSLRENHIFGTSCTIVLCGQETRWRKFVDWEIDVTLSMKHGLIGVLLPTNPIYSNGGAHKPERLQDNVDSGYAVWTTWQDIIRNGPHFVREKVALANERSTNLIRNDRPRMERNGTPPWKKNSLPPLPTYL
jgi:MTH538 TIR-like domain (DUF1863)